MLLYLFQITLDYKDKLKFTNYFLHHWEPSLPSLCLQKENPFIQRSISFVLQM